MHPNGWSYSSSFLPNKWVPPLWNSNLLPFGLSDDEWFSDFSFSSSGVVFCRSPESPRHAAFHVPGFSLTYPSVSDDFHPPWAAKLASAISILVISSYRAANFASMFFDGIRLTLLLKAMAICRFKIKEEKCANEWMPCGFSKDLGSPQTKLQSRYLPPIQTPLFILSVNLLTVVSYQLLFITVTSQPLQGMLSSLFPLTPFGRAY